MTTLSEQHCFDALGSAMLRIIVNSFAVNPAKVQMIILNSTNKMKIM